jgi:hypothetical protein
MRSRSFAKAQASQKTSEDFEIEHPMMHHLFVNKRIAIRTIKEVSKMGVLALIFHKDQPTSKTRYICDPVIPDVTIQNQPDGMSK